MTRRSIHDRVQNARNAYLEVGGTMDDYERCCRIIWNGDLLDAAMVFAREAQAHYAGGLFALNRMLRKFGYDLVAPGQFHQRDVPLVAMAADAWDRFVGVGGELSMYEAGIWRTKPQAFFAGELFEYNRFLHAFGVHYHPAVPYDDLDKAVAEYE